MALLWRWGAAAERGLSCPAVSGNWDGSDATSDWCQLEDKKNLPPNISTR